jgi:hypothetical protein
MKKQKGMVASSGLEPDNEYIDFRTLTMGQFQSKSINPFDDIKEKVESPPLWVWAIIVGAIVVAKFTLRWSRLKQLARELRKGNKTGS